jgi:hypothetical protein
MTVRRPPLWDAPASFVLSRLKEAGARIAERCFGPVKSVEDMREMLWGDAGAIVPDARFGLAV